MWGNAIRNAGNCHGLTLIEKLEQLKDQFWLVFFFFAVVVAASDVLARQFLLLFSMQGSRKPF